MSDGRWPDVAAIPAIPDAIDPIRGYRYFALHGGVLRSVTRDVAWLPGTNVAGCDVRHGLRVAGCHFIGWYDADPPLIQVDPGLTGRMEGCIIEYDGFAGPVELVMAQGGAIRDRRFIASSLRIRLEPGSTPLPPPGHEVPVADCTCGFYAVSPGHDLERPDGAVTALVEGWGRVQLHAGGWRSQYARITGLLARGFRERRRVRRVADAYGVPVLERSERA